MEEKKTYQDTAAKPARMNKLGEWYYSEHKNFGVRIADMKAVLK